MRTYRLLVTTGSLGAALVWIAKAPVLFEMMRTGEISPVTPLLLLAAVVSLCVGGVRVHLGKSGRPSFALHIMLASAAGLLMRFFLPVPLAVGVLVGIVALVGSFMVQQAAARDARTAGIAALGKHDG